MNRMGDCLFFLFARPPPRAIPRRIISGERRENYRQHLYFRHRHAASATALSANAAARTLAAADIQLASGFKELQPVLSCHQYDTMAAKSFSIYGLYRWLTGSALTSEIR